MKRLELLEVAFVALAFVASSGCVVEDDHRDRHERREDRREERHEEHHEQRSCPRCGALIDVDARVCVKCGVSIR
jgi:ribosomal protein L40E